MRRLVVASFVLVGLVGCGAFLSLSDDEESGRPPPPPPSNDGDVTLLPIEAGGAGDGAAGADGSGADGSSPGTSGGNTNGPTWSCGGIESPTFNNPTECAADRAMRNCAQSEVKIPQRGAKCSPGGGNGVEQTYCEECAVASYAFAKCVCKKP